MRLLAPLSLLLTLVLAAVPAGSVPEPDLAPTAVGEGGGVLSWVEVFAEDGTISWAQVELPQAPLTAAEAAALAGSGVSLLHGDGAAGRYNLVIVGDGYTAEERDVFTAHATDKVEAILAEEPFTTYAAMFNIWGVEVVSAESGVDNDPLPGPDRDTALDMQFWCNGIERLLCVNQAKARAAADAVRDAQPGVTLDVDHVLVLANSTKYGGAGGTVATSSGGNAAASLVTIHELGHSIGGLADEYEYYARAGLSEDSTEDVTVPAPGLSGLPGQEPRGANITARSTPEALAAGQLKWFRWLGEESPDGGTVGTYEGGGYSPVFIYRPTEDSLMHTLGIAKGGNRFNVVAIEEMTAAFHRAVDVIAGAETGVDEAGRSTFAVEVIRYGSAPYRIAWSLDGVPLPVLDGQTQVSIDAAPGSEVTVRVTDTTPFVRNPALVENALTDSRTWTVPAG